MKENQTRDRLNIGQDSKSSCSSCNWPIYLIYPYGGNLYDWVQNHSLIQYSFLIISGILHRGQYSEFTGKMNCFWPLLCHAVDYKHPKSMLTGWFSISIRTCMLVINPYFARYIFTHFLCFVTTFHDELSDTMSLWTALQSDISII